MRKLSLWFDALARFPFALENPARTTTFSNLTNIRPRPCPKSGVAGTDKLILGARAPSPAEACAARSISTFWTLFSRFALIAGEGARVPSTNRLVPDWIDFLGKALVTGRCALSSVGASELLG